MQWTAFYFAGFTNATFADGDLSEATIVESNLSQANLNGVNLTNANLQRSKFVGADLSGASSVDRLLKVFEDKIVRLAEAKFNQLVERRNRAVRVENV